MSQLGEQSVIKGNWGKKHHHKEEIRQNVITLISGCDWGHFDEYREDRMIEQAFRIANKIENYK